ncbi:hypothetical protein IGI37_002736 [Enterococcus sp. AZ194]|uniref:hypothetical protein n=1 Tax=Enterococcus sp. AZ194 TaxID=2774629 RepID=UPI003F1FF0BC
MSQTEVITLCGSIKFEQTFKKVEMTLSQKGLVILSPVFFELGDKPKLTDEEKEILGAVHLKKIDLADGIFVIDVDGYIGERTQLEIVYARQNKKKITYYSTEKTRLGL